MSQCARTEPTIDEIMADPTIHALMRADRVNVDRLRLKLLQHAQAAGALDASAHRPARTAASALRAANETRRMPAWG